MKDIAQHLQKSGHIVVEGPQAELQTVPKPEGRELPALPQIFGGAMWGGASDEMVGIVAPSDLCPIDGSEHDQGSACTVGVCRCHARPSLHRAVSLK